MKVWFREHINQDDCDAMALLQARIQLGGDLQNWMCHSRKLWFEQQTNANAAQRFRRVANRVKMLFLFVSSMRVQQ